MLHFWPNLIIVKMKCDRKILSRLEKDLSIPRPDMLAIHNFWPNLILSILPFWSDLDLAEIDHRPRIKVF